MGPVVFVGKSSRDVRGRDRGNEDVFVGQAFSCRLEVCNIRLDRLVTSIADRSGASINVVTPPSASTAKRFGDTLGPCIVLGEGEILSTGCARSHGPRSGGLALEAVESFDNVAEEARFALLAIGDDIDACFDLFPNNLRNRLAHNACEFVAVVGLSFLSQSKKRCQGIGPGQAAHMGREDSVRALLHGIPLSIDKFFCLCNSIPRLVSRPFSRVPSVKCKPSTAEELVDIRKSETHCASLFPFCITTICDYKTWPLFRLAQMPTRTSPPLFSVFPKFLMHLFYPSHPDRGKITDSVTPLSRNSFLME